ncbi:MAG TPA: hypothetical protein VJX23_01010 [Candidatus Binataceae bacterium]|nr:hypothetical protein [Candidatus Binataceae bacterium]
MAVIFVAPHSFVPSAPLFESTGEESPDLPLEGMRRHRLAFRVFPIRWFDSYDRYASGRVILAGDAAGVDPLMGEGISCAFEYGRIAAAAIGRFLGGDRTRLAAMTGNCIAAR